VGDLLPLLHGHYPVSSLLRSSAPLVGVSVLSASWVIHLCLFPYHHRPGSQVPYESPDKSHASCTPDTAWPVSRYLPCCSQSKGKPRFWCHLSPFDASSEVRLHSSLLPILDVIGLSRLLTITFTTAAFGTEAAYGSLRPPPTRRLRRVHLHLSYSTTISRLPDTTPAQTRTGAH